MTSQEAKIALNEGKCIRMVAWPKGFYVLKPYEDSDRVTDPTGMPIALIQLPPRDPSDEWEIYEEAGE